MRAPRRSQYSFEQHRMYSVRLLRRAEFERVRVTVARRHRQDATAEEPASDSVIVLCRDSDDLAIRNRHDCLHLREKCLVIDDDAAIGHADETGAAALHIETGEHLLAV